MTGPVFIHVGVPKTGTTYLQSILHQQRRVLRQYGVLYPGPRRSHQFEAVDLMGGRFAGDPLNKFPGSWDRLMLRVRRWPGPVILSHEILSEAPVEAIDRAMDDLAGRPVHLVCTARDLASTLRGAWQESVKNGKALPLDAFVVARQAEAVVDSLLPQSRTSFQDPSRVLARWARNLDPQAVHVVTVPASRSSTGVLWRRFAEATGVPVEFGDVDVSRSNPSLGQPETEFLRRLNEELRTRPGVSRDVYRTEVKAKLARALAERPSPPVGLSLDQRSWADALSRAAVRSIGERGYRVHGDLADLIPSGHSSLGPAAPVTREQESAVALAAAATLIERIAELKRPPDTGESSTSDEVGPA